VNNQNNNSLKQKFAKWLALFLPGIFLLGFNIVCTFFMINLYGRYTLVTGETALQAFRKHIHPAVGLFFIAALTAGVCGSVMGVMGIVADICYEWSKSFVDGGIPPLYFAAFFVSLVYFIFWNGKTQFFERSLAVIVAVMSACFLINFFVGCTIDTLRVDQKRRVINYNKSYHFSELTPRKVLTT